MDAVSAFEEEVVVVSKWGFAAWWLIFLGVHVVTCGYNVVFAMFYWVLNDLEISQYLVFYHVGMPPVYYKIIAIVPVAMALVHGSCIVLMVGSSFWLRRLAFTPWGELNISTTRKKSIRGKGVMKKIQVETRSDGRVNSVIRNGVSKLTTNIINRYGFFGVNGQYFHMMSTLRELVETALQTIQAYRMSRLLPNMLLNRFYVVSLVLNCWSSGIVHTSLFRNEARKRFASLASDCALNLLACMGVTFIVVLHYLGQYDPATTDFGVNPWYNDEWAARALNEFQMVVVVSWPDLASRVVFSLGLIMTTTNMKELLYRSPRRGNRVANFSNSTPVVTQTLKVKSTNSVPPTVRLLPATHNNQANTNHAHGRLWKFAIHAAHVLFFIWGITVLGLHIHASIQPSLLQCTLQVRPWAVSRPYCFLVSLDCYRLGITGQIDEVDVKWREFDGSTTVMMVIKHCPLLDVPDIFTEFHQLISIKIYNTTIIDWKESAAITNTNHPKFLSLMLVRVNTTGGLLPAGFQSTDMPLNLYDFEFCVTNLRELPDDLDSKWFPGSYVIIEYSQLRAVPPALIRLMPPYFSLTGNPISELPPEIFEIEGLTDLGIGDTNIRELPRNVTQLSTALSTIYVEGTNISYFWAWTDQFLGRVSVRGIPRSIYAGGTVYCDDLESIRNRSAEAFSVSPSSEYSPLLLNASEAGSDGNIWSWVDCNPGISGFSGPLYPLVAEDSNNAIKGASF